MLLASFPWDAVICAVVSKTLSRTPLLLHDSQKPLCTLGRMPMSFEPLLGGWSVRQVCTDKRRRCKAQITDLSIGVARSCWDLVDAI